MRKINLDYGAAAPLDPAVVQAMLPYMTEYYGNPSSGHSLGAKPRQALKEAREKVARLIAAPPERVLFTSSASEANNLAIKGVVAAYKKKGNHIIASPIEHYSVLNPLKSLQKAGFEITFLPVDSFGLVDAAQLAEAITDKTVLVSIAVANPEIGTVQDVTGLSQVAKEKGVLFHTDATAAVGWMDLDVKKLGVDLLTLAGDQFYGPKGTGALYVRKGVRLLPLVEGGIQELGLRAGTENVAAFVGMGVAAHMAFQDRQERVKRVSQLRDQLKEGLFAEVPHLHVNGHEEKRLPHNLHVAVEFVEGEALFMHLDMAGIYVSSGSSCASQALKSSQVLAAIGAPPELAQGSLLFTLGKDTKEEDISYVTGELSRIAALLRQMSPLYSKYLKEGRV